MGGIRVVGTTGQTVLHPVVWADPEEVPVVFVVVNDDATALAHPDYIAGNLYDIANGDLNLAEAWDDLLVKTPALPYPQKCRVRMIPDGRGAAEILVANQVVYKFS